MTPELVLEWVMTGFIFFIIIAFIVIIISLFVMLFKNK